LASAFAES